MGESLHLLGHALGSLAAYNRPGSRQGEAPRRSLPFREGEPPLARAIAGAVVKALGVEPERPEGVLALGDPALLYMEMSEAAEHFGVKPPIGRRDRKSGAKKRKQHEIEEERRKIRAING